MRIQRGDRGSGPPPPPETYKNIGFLSNIGPDPLKITKLPSQHSMLGHHRPASETPFKWPASETPFKWRFAGGTMMARLYCYLDPLSPNQPKNVKKSWTPSEKNFLDPHMATVVCGVLWLVIGLISFLIFQISHYCCVTVCVLCPSLAVPCTAKIVSMIRKCHNHKLQIKPWNREEEPHNNLETPER